ncbi:hypothetical protein RD792_015865 [Penstemon davidsonii]|uniref:Uncharacterized protein n=1 Tax=Penstemon davidsonii TaxID=160366 RepID=A0ABR0CIH2_9LAMI|nr:hypothetical protein RD792_015865 [Penstemon davidsonii]
MGTLVRVFKAMDGSLLRELRRGSERAKIYSLCFSLNAQWLGVSSDKGTVHVFSLIDKEVDSGSIRINESMNPNSASISHLSSFIKVAKFRVQEGLPNIVAFGHQKNTLVIIGIDGSFYRCEFDPVLGGEMTKLEHHNFLR